MSLPRNFWICLHFEGIFVSKHDGAVWKTDGSPMNCELAALLVIFTAQIELLECCAGYNTHDLYGLMASLFLLGGTDTEPFAIDFVWTVLYISLRQLVSL